MEISNPNPTSGNSLALAEVPPQSPVMACGNWGGIPPKDGRRPHSKDKMGQIHKQDGRGTIEDHLNEDGKLIKFT
uniref:Uncharacterized protein n=1 Tax=Leersia perrieri TaxID=77586 RepID=A0A0D9V1D3_9ORYZ